MAHLRDEHKLTCLEYAQQYPDAPVFSALGAGIIKPMIQDAIDAAGAGSDREYEDVQVEDLFSWPGEEYVVRKYSGASPLVPPGNDEGFVYDYDATLALLFGLHRKQRNSVWIAGYAGTGKTQLVLNVCRKLGREVVRVNLDSSLTRADIVGDWVLRNGETTFQYGPLPRAMKRGAVLLLDEMDLVNPYVMPIFRPVLEEHPSLTIVETGGELVLPSDGFAIVATANTWGQGDDTGLYGNTQSLSLADRQRFSIFVEMDYLPAEAEKGLVRERTKNESGDYDMDEDEAGMMVQVAGRIRELYKEGKIEESISPRQLVNWAEIFCETGNAQSAANMAFLLPLGESTRLAITQLINESGIGRGG